MCSRQVLETAAYFPLLVGYEREQGSYDRYTLSKPKMKERKHHAFLRASWDRFYGKSFFLDVHKRLVETPVCVNQSLSPCKRPIVF